MNKIRSGCFALIEVEDGHHDKYNWWHSSDHIPENLALQDVVLGTRWSAPSRYIDARLAIASSLKPHQYLVNYLMTDPLERAFRDFSNLGERTYDLGRSFAFRHVLYNGHHRLIKGYVSVGERISAEALPFRPHRGVFVVIADATQDPIDPQLARWCNGTHIPSMLSIDGVLGAYWYKSVSRLGRGGVPLASEEAAIARHIFVYYLGIEPLAVTEQIRTQVPGWSTLGSLPGHDAAMAVVLAAPYEVIVDPERYRWADR